jgi:hypothetical protein
MLAQVAQAAKDTDLLDLAAACHPQTLRQLRWTNTMIKTLSPQLLTHGVTGSSVPRHGAELTVRQTIT